MTRLYRTIASASAAAGALALAGCAVQPASTILSRLPEPAAATGDAHALTPAERKRYDEIDRQVLREQNDAIAADAAMRAWSYYAPYYAPAPVTFYGGYSNGGWGPRWGTGFGYGYPGW